MQPKTDPDPIPSITLLMDSVKKIVTYSTLETKLRQSVETRWDINFGMIESVLDNIQSSENESRLAVHFSNINIGLVKEVSNLLKPFKTERENLCKESGPTSHAVFLSYRKLERQMLS